MGTAATWISVAGLTPTDLLDRIGAVDTGEVVTWPGRRQMAWAELPSGRLLVLSRAFIFAPTRHHELSFGADVVGGRVEDHVGYSASWQCKDGEFLWSMAHDPLLPGELLIEGVLPSPYAAKWQAALEADDEEIKSDVAYGLPLEAAVELGRFAYEDFIDDWDGNLRVLSGGDDFMRIAQVGESRDHKAFIKEWRAQKRAQNPGLGGFLNRLFGG